MICDAEVGQVFSGMIPLGHFTLRDTPVSKCFIGTGTGFAPLYCQMLGCIERGLTTAPITFVFGVRNIEDSFYDTEIMGLSE
jgi:NAD(P)H-flavin reductase